MPYTGRVGAETMLRLEAASPNPPPGFRELLSDLGDGENGFGGTPVHTGAATLEEYPKQCCDMRESANFRSGLVPQKVFWVLDADGIAARDRLVSAVGRFNRLGTLRN